MVLISIIVLFVLEVCRQYDEKNEIPNHSIQNQTAVASEEMGNTTSRIKNLQNKIESLVSHFWEDYELTRSILLKCEEAKLLQQLNQKATSLFNDFLLIMINKSTFYEQFWSFAEFVGISLTFEQATRRRDRLEAYLKELESFSFNAAKRILILDNDIKNLRSFVKGKGCWINIETGSKALMPISEGPINREIGSHLDQYLTFTVGILLIILIFKFA